MKRRSFLRHTTHGLTIPGIFSALGPTNSYAHGIERLMRLANDSDKALVLIYLNGGNDGLNTVIPLPDYEKLRNVRPHVILPENVLPPIAGQNFAFHPSLSNFKSLYLEDRLQVIHSVGYPEQNFSHFRSTDIWMSASDADQLVTSGWGGRYLESLHPTFPEEYPTDDFPDPLAIEIGHGSSLLFQGQSNSMSMVFNDVSSFYRLVENSDEEVPDTLAGEKLRYVRLIANQSQIYGETVKAAADQITNQLSYPGSTLANQLKVVSRMIAGGLRTPLYLVSLGGFDTHDAQVIATDHTIGEHASLLEQLDSAVMAFLNDLEHLGVADRVVGLTFSEFGRRIVSNASLGTDHGSAAPLFVFGNAVRGGSLGSLPTITGEETYQDNLPMQYDFRQVYQSLLSQWFEADESTTTAATLQAFDELPIIGEGVVSAVSQEPIAGLKLYPNPVLDFATLELMTEVGHLQIEILSATGQKLQVIHSGFATSPKMQLRIDLTRYPRGIYLIQILSGQKLQSLKMLKV